MSRQDERYTADFSGHYDLTDDVKPYVEFSFMDDKTHQQVAPTALFRGSQVLTVDNNYRINCGNPLMSQQQRDIMCSAADQAADAASWAAHLADPNVAYSPVLAEMEIGRRNVEGGGREYDFDHSAYRAVLGATGDFATAWSYDLYGQFYYVDFYSKNTKDIDLSKVANALVAQLDATGTPVCASGGSCVPYNAFNGNGVLQTDLIAGVTQDALDYMYQVGTQSGNDQLGTIHLDFTGKLGEYGIKLPTAVDGLSINVGYENRREHQEYVPDGAIQSGLLAGTGGTRHPLRRQPAGEGILGRAAHPAGPGEDARRGSQRGLRLPPLGLLERCGQRRHLDGPAPVGADRRDAVPRVVQQGDPRSRASSSSSTRRWWAGCRWATIPAPRARRPASRQPRSPPA